MRYVFSNFVLDIARMELTQDSKTVSLEPKSFDLLVLLAKNHDRVVSKDEIFD